MSSKQLGSALVVTVLVAVGIVAAVDAVRSTDAAERPASPRVGSGREDPADLLTARLDAEGIQGVLYYSDPEDDCRIHALRLPALDEAPPPKLRACRFELPPAVGTGATLDGVAWHPGGHLAAACRRGQVELLTPTGAPAGEVEGCAPAWKPDGTLTVIRKGELWSVRAACIEAEAKLDPACERRILSVADLTKTARRVPFVPTDRRHLRSATAFKAAWFSDTRAVVLARVRLRGRLRVLGQAVLAVYEGSRLLEATPHAGAIDLRLSPRRASVGVIEAGERVVIVNRSGRQQLAAAELPSPSAHSIAWSPDERWTAIASRWSVYLLPTADINAGRRPRVVRLPLAARDIAWRWRHYSTGSSRAFGR